MNPVIARSYLSPTLVLLAMDWPDGVQHKDFIGFAVNRTPGFWNPKTKSHEPSSWLPNRINFDGPPPEGQPDFPSDKAPIQKFLWWDARIDEDDRGRSLTYEIWPVRGNKNKQDLVKEAKTVLQVTLPQHEEKGVGTYFNRAVVSSQAFSKKLKAMGVDPKVKPGPENEKILRAWLANDMERVIPDFLDKAGEVVGAIYHLTDNTWIIPALHGFSETKRAAMVYDAKEVRTKSGNKPGPNEPVVAGLGDTVEFHPRDKVAIMHNKFMVSGSGLGAHTNSRPVRVVCGSANYTTAGLTSQANLMHTFDSQDLARYYLERFGLLKENPTLGETAKQNAGWSDMVTVGDAGIRVFFSPEPTGQKKSVDTIVQAIHNARSSVCFCLFTPTDNDLRDACFAAGDNGKMMFGLVNRISKPKDPDVDPEDLRSDQLAALELYHRSKDNRDVIGAEYFHPNTVPQGFEPELLLFPGDPKPPYPPVIIHHKFIIIDAETDTPIIYSGSANMSKNSVNKNDENLLEIVGSRRIAAIYLAEFMRLYEHYRARAAWIHNREEGSKATGFKLAEDSGWCSTHYTPGTPEYKARVKMVCL